MPKPIQALTLRELEQLVEGWEPVRKIDSVHIHCTDRPRHADFRGLPTVEAMRAYHMSIGMSDIAQHLTIDPGGLLWTGRPFDTKPASVRGHNGTAKLGPFMIEMVGLFQNGVDTFKDAQKDAAYAVVCTILRKFGLDESAVKFHREFPNTGKTCPGSDLDPASFRADIAAELASPTLHTLETTVPRDLPRGPLDRTMGPAETAAAEAEHLEVPESERALLEQELVADWIERGLLDPANFGGTRDIDEDYRELLPHVVNMSQGVLSAKGKMATTVSDLDRLIEHLDAAFASGKYQHLVFYAHGGLVSEKSALEYAKLMAPWWRSYGVYPIFFLWESSLFQTIWQRPRELGRAGRGVGDFFDRFVEGTTQLLARKIWKEMKENARRCSEPMTEKGRPGGLFLFWQKLKPWLEPRNGQITLHAIGHSTGPILLARFMRRLIDDGLSFSSLSYLAPAIRTDDFQREVQPLLGNGIGQLREFTMNDEAERNDNVALIYRKSLLYYVREACEDKTDGRILGLERDLYADQAMRTLFGLKEKSGDFRAPLPRTGTPLATIEFSQDGRQHEKNERTLSTAHGFFDNDPATMSHVLARMLGREDLKGLSGGIRFPAEQDLRAALELDELSREARARGGEQTFETETCPCCCHREQAKASEPDEFDPAYEEPPEEEDSARPAPTKPKPTSGGGAGTGRRIAVCVGINDYPRQPLGGCVRDSENWAKVLAKAGFEIRTLRDGQATRAGLVGALRKLIQDGKKGDQLVFQFAGHGSQVEDLSGDEDDPFDEVLVPIDFDRGELLIDDDTYALCQDLRSGARLTFFMDCCHSGTNTRFAPRLAATRGDGPRPRFITLNQRDVEAYRGARRQIRALPPVSDRNPLPGVVSFAACRDREVALEEEGQGVFSRHALAVFDRVLRDGGSNRDFFAAVERHFGTDTRQHPLLDKTAPGLAGERFLGGS